MHRTRLAAAALTAPLALALVGCGDSDDDSAAPAPSSGAASTSTSASASSPATTSATGDAPAAATTGGDLLTAAATGLAAVDGATLFSVGDQDSGGWEVSVVTADGKEHDVRVSADGTSVTGGPSEEVDDGDDATTDVAERQDLLAVPVDYQGAVDAASGSGGTTLTGLDLDQDRGAAVWEVTWDDDTADEVTVRVDAQSGEVLGVDRDR